jgi:hypothetical protein
LGLFGSFGLAEKKVRNPSNTFFTLLTTFFSQAKENLENHEIKKRDKQRKPERPVAREKGTGYFF